MKTKKIISLACAFLLACSACPLTVSAKKYEPIIITGTEEDISNVRNKITVDGLIYFPNTNSYSVTDEYGNKTYTTEITSYYLDDVEDTTITSVTIPAEINGLPVVYDDIVALDENPFRFCDNLTEILVEDADNSDWKSIDGVLYYKNALVSYPNAKPDSELTIPDFVEIIEFNAFYNCPALETLTIPDSLCDTRWTSFVKCKNLKTINGTLPVGDVNNYWYISNFPNLQSLSLKCNSSIKRNDGLFAACEPLCLENLTNLETLTIVDKDLYFYDINVINCPSLTTVYSANIINVDCQVVMVSGTELPILPLESETTVTKGDATGNGEVDITDIIIANKAILGQKTLTAEQVKALDIDGNGIVDTTDSLAIMKYIVGLIESL
ncbi:MAG: leucine-rich repeat protein [Oscillospiraceae bacterium]|nr:leucine-rich repeat protein [Oscillospiraceae bacterium]